MSLRLKAFSCPATSESSNTLSPAGLRKDLDPQQPTPSRYDVCEMSGLGAHFLAFCKVAEQDIFHRLRSDWLWEEVIHAGIYAPLTVGWEGVCRDRDDMRQLVALKTFSNLSRCLESIHLGHFNIHEDQVVSVGTDRPDGFSPVRYRVDAIAEFFQHLNREALVRRIVFSKQYAAGVALR